MASSLVFGREHYYSPVRSLVFWEKRFGILLWNLFEFEGFESVFLSSGFQRLVNSSVDLDS